MSNKSTNEIDVLIGQKILQKRIEAGLTRQVVAKKLGITHQQLQKCEEGTNRVPANRVVLLAKILNTTPMYLLSVDPTEYANIKAGRGLLALMSGFSGLSYDSQIVVRALVARMSIMEG